MSSKILSYHVATAQRLRTLVLALVATGLFACGDFGGGSGGTPGGGSGATSGSGTSGGGGNAAPTSEAESILAFSQTVQPLTMQYCGNCHSGAGPGSPNISHPDATQAYFATINNQKVDLGNPPASRLVARLAQDLHHCWTSCTADAAEMAAAIAQWANVIGYNSSNTQVAGVIRSADSTLGAGVEIDSLSQRYSDNIIAFWDFKEGQGLVANDTSGVTPDIPLTLEGPTWLTNFGIDIDSGRAIADSATSRKLYDLIGDADTGSQQYSIEAWVIPANISQEGPARIVSYSNGTGSRNFTLGQVLYSYDFRNRSLAPGVNNNGSPSLLTYDVDRDLQATLQHVVATFDQYRGRRIYVDAVWTDDMDESGGGRLFSWSQNHRFVLGNETSNNRQWQGKIQMVAIHKEALSDADILQNYLAGVGRKVVVQFDTSAWSGPGSYLEFLVSEIDNFSYMFCEPTFYGVNPNGTRIAGIRIAVNGVIPVSGQAFVGLDTGAFLLPTRLSNQCTVVRKDLGPGMDIFSIDFEVLEGFEHLEVVTYPPPPPDMSVLPTVPETGFRAFALINATMSTITGVPATTPAVQSVYLGLEQQLPATADLRSFVTSNQVGIAKLALQYCDTLVDDPVRRDAFFGPFAWDQPTNVAFASQVERDQIIDALYDQGIGLGLSSQPDYADDPVTGAPGVHSSLDGLITTLINSCDATTPCDALRTRTIVKGVCTAVVASGAAQIH